MIIRDKIIFKYLRLFDIIDLLSLFIVYHIFSILRMICDLNKFRMD